jgi:hypothetical protein
VTLTGSQSPGYIEPFPTQPIGYQSSQQEMTSINDSNVQTTFNSSNVLHSKSRLAQLFHRSTPSQGNISASAGSGREDNTSPSFTGIQDSATGRSGSDNTSFLPENGNHNVASRSGKGNDRGSISPRPIMTLPTSLSIEAELPRRGSEGARILRHEDSGVRIASKQAEEEVVEVPPVYTTT